MLKIQYYIFLAMSRIANLGCGFVLEQNKRTLSDPFHETRGIRTPDNLIKSQVLYQLS